MRLSPFWLFLAAAVRARNPMPRSTCKLHRTVTFRHLKTKDSVEGKKMLIKKPTDIRYSEITPKHIYLNRRKFLFGVPAALLGARALAGTKLPNVQKSTYTVAEKQNSYQDVSTYNNYYEFGTDRSEEHTSELQSLRHLVCRLLLEKK